MAAQRTNLQNISAQNIKLKVEMQAEIEKEQEKNKRQHGELQKIKDDIKNIGSKTLSIQRPGRMSFAELSSDPNIMSLRTYFDKEMAKSGGKANHTIVEANNMLRRITEGGTAAELRQSIGQAADILQESLDQQTEMAGFQTNAGYIGVKRDRSGSHDSHKKKELILHRINKTMGGTYWQWQTKAKDSNPHTNPITFSQDAVISIQWVGDTAGFYLRQQATMEKVADADDEKKTTFWTPGTPGQTKLEVCKKAKGKKGDRAKQTFDMIVTYSSTGRASES